MQKPLRKACVLALAVAAGSLTLLTASPASAIGVRPVDPTSQPASTAPPPHPNPPALWPAPPPAPSPPRPAPTPPPTVPGYQPWHKIRPVDPTTQPESTASPWLLVPPPPAPRP